MFNKAWLAAAAAAAMYWAAAGAAPLEAYGKLPSLTNLTISPDGGTIAYVHDAGDKRTVQIQSLTNGQKLGGLNLGDTKVRGLAWADNHTIVISTSVTAQPWFLEGPRGEYSLAQTYDLQTQKQRVLLDRVKVNAGHDVDTMNVITGEPQPRIIDGKTMIFVPGVFFANHKGAIGIFRIDTENNVGQLITRDTDLKGEDWLIDQSGNIVAEARYYDVDQRWKLSIVHGSSETSSIEVPASIETPSIVGLNDNSTAVVVALPQEDGHAVYQQISLADGTASPWEHANLGPGDVMTSSRTGQVIGAERVGSKHDYTFFDPRTETVWRSVKSAFKDADDIELVSWSDDRSLAIVRIFGETYGDAYFLINMTTHRADPLGNVRDGVTEIAPRQWIEYKAADGRPINAYLTLPRNRDAKNLPLIVLPHGGPHARDEPGFDWISQALASRGYAVLQPQFRGSDGFGYDLLSAGFGEFGKKMQTDLSDGVRALAGQGVIDPKRVCIVGASYGGYAALAGATLDTGVYRCAVSIAGLSDLKGQLKYFQEHSDRRNSRFWDRFLGVTSASDPALDAISPVKHADKVTIPILLIHGRDDTVVPFAQSENMADALKAAGKPYTFVELKKEDHWLSRGETRLQMLQTTVQFLEANNPPN